MTNIEYLSKFASNKHSPSKKIANQQNTSTQKQLAIHGTQNGKSEEKKDLFKFGNYGWLGTHRKQSMMGRVDTNWKKSDLPLDVFHSCYLFNTERNREMSEKEKTIMKPILNDDDLRMTTVQNDMLSRMFAVKFINALEKELEKEMQKEAGKNENGQDDNDDEQGNGKDGKESEIDADTLQKIAQRSCERAKRDTKKTEKMANAFGKLAGDEKGKFFYEKNINPNYYLDIDQLIMQLRSIDLKMEEKEPEITGIPSGLSFGSDLDSVLPSELALPDDFFYYKYATDSLLQHDKKAEKVIEPVLILIDKSQSMDNRDKMVFSRTVAFLIAEKSIRDGADTYLQFFDTQLYPENPISLKNDKEKFITELLSLQNSGGTSIQSALMSIKNSDLRKVVLITDGEDSVNKDAKPNFPLVSVFVGGNNSDLEMISDNVFTINNDIKEIVMGN